jgi:hypothetical protein
VSSQCRLDEFAVDTSRHVTVVFAKFEGEKMLG